jgi:hypothetical protein
VSKSKRDEWWKKNECKVTAQRREVERRSLIAKKGKRVCREI